MFINHIHLMPEDLRADATPEKFLAAIPPVVEGAGHAFEGAVAFAPFRHQFDAAGRTDCPNVWLCEAIRSHSELVGYGTLDPGKPAGKQVEQIAALGFRGIKLHPPAQKFEIFGSWAREGYAAMEELGLVADFHIGMHGHRLKDSDPLLCDEIAHHYPRLRMVFEHVGGWHYYRLLLGVMTNNLHHGEHLYAGIASVLNRDGQPYWWIGPEGVNDCRWQLGPGLLIYGLDFPYNAARQLRNDLAQIALLDWPPADIEALLGGNLRRLLGLSVQAGSEVESSASKGFITESGSE